MEGGSKEDKPSKPMPAVTKMSLSIMATLEEGWQKVKSTIVGRVKMVTAKNEVEASEAELNIAKEQVEATDEAERKKQQLQK